MTFQGAVGALFAATAVADRPLDARFGIGAVRIKELRFEAEAPLDDIMIATDADGYVFTQVKTSLTLAKKLDSGSQRRPNRSFGNGLPVQAATARWHGIDRSWRAATHF